MLCHRCFPSFLPSFSCPPHLNRSSYFSRVRAENLTLALPVGRACQSGRGWQKAREVWSADMPGFSESKREIGLAPEARGQHDTALPPPGSSASVMVLRVYLFILSQLHNCIAFPECHRANFPSQRERENAQGLFVISDTMRRWVCLWFRSAEPPSLSIIEQDVETLPAPSALPLKCVFFTLPLHWSIAY